MNRKLFVVLFVVLTAVLLPGCASVPVGGVVTQEEPRVSLPGESSEVARARIFSSDTEALLRLGEEVKITDVGKVVAFLKQGTIATPMEAGFSVPKNTSASSLMVVVLLKGETQYPLWEKYRNDIPEGVRFYPRENMLIVADVISHPYKETMLYLAGLTAMSFSQGAQGLQRPVHTGGKSACASTRDMVARINDALSLLGGDKYAVFVAEQMRVLGGQAERNRGIGGPSALGKDVDTGLDGIFGPARDDAERAVRRTLLWLDLVFRLIDTNPEYALKSAEQKADAVCWLGDQNKRSSAITTL